jgi:hypothetical protein
MDQGWRPNLSWVTPDLAVGGSFPRGEARALVRGHGVGAVIDMRGEASDDPAEMTANGLAFLRLPTADHAAVTQPMLDRAARFARAAAADERRLLIHCEHGIGRSATAALCVLVDRGFGPLEALTRAKAARGLVSPSPAQYEAWSAWLQRRAAWASPIDFEAFRAIAYRTLTQGA